MEAQSFYRAWKESKDLLKSANIEPTADGREFCERLGMRLQIPIDIQLWDLQGVLPGVSGLLVRTPSKCYIIIERNDHPEKQNRSILHEGGHLAFNHKPALLLSEDMDLEQVFEILRGRPAVWDRSNWARRHGFLARHRHDTREEQQAEAFAMVVETLGKPSSVETYAKLHEQALGTIDDTRSDLVRAATWCLGKGRDLLDRLSQARRG